MLQTTSKMYAFMQSQLVWDATQNFIPLDKILWFLLFSFAELRFVWRQSFGASASVRWEFDYLRIASSRPLHSKPSPNPQSWVRGERWAESVNRRPEVWPTNYHKMHWGDVSTAASIRMGSIKSMKICHRVVSFSHAAMEEREHDCSVRRLPSGD